MTAGTVNIYIPLRHDNGERMTGIVPKGMRTRAAFTRSVEVRPFFDPLATRNLPNAIPMTDPGHPMHPRSVAKRAPLTSVAPAGWRLRPVELTSVSPELASPEHCGKRFRTPSGFAWHLQNVHAGAAE